MLAERKQSATAIREIKLLAGANVMAIDRGLLYLFSMLALSVPCFIRAKFDEAAFYFAVHCLTNKPAFLGRTVVVRAYARAAFVCGDGRVPERAFSKPVKVATEDGLKVQPITALE
jgi:hypothetical protein